MIWNIPLVCWSQLSQLRHLTISCPLPAYSTWHWAPERLVRETAVMLCRHCWAIPRTLVYYQYHSRYKYSLWIVPFGCGLLLKDCNYENGFNFESYMICNLWFLPHITIKYAFQYFTFIIKPSLSFTDIFLLDKRCGCSYPQNKSVSGTTCFVLWRDVCSVYNSWSQGSILATCHKFRFTTYS